MRFRNYLITGLFLITVTALLGCEKLKIFFPPKKTEIPVTVKGTIVAKVANMPLTLESVNREIEDYNKTIDASKLPEARKKELRIDTSEKKKKFVENIVRQMVFYQAALDRGLDRDEETHDLLERTRASILSQKIEDDLIKDIAVSPKEVEDYYTKEIKGKYKQPELRRIREIVVRTEPEARQIYSELLQGADFAVIARDRSIAKSAKNGGGLGEIKKGERFPAFDDLAFSVALQPGDLSSVFKGPEGYYIIKVESIKEGKEPTLAELQDDIKDGLLEQKRKQVLDSFYKQATKDTIKEEIFYSEIK